MNFIKGNNIKSIKIKMLLVLLPVIFLASSILASFAYLNGKNTLIKTNKGIMLELAKSYASKVNDQLENSLEIMKVLAKNPIIIDPKASWNLKKATLESINKIEEYRSIGIADLKGNLEYTSGEKVNIGDRDYFKMALKGQSVVSQPFISKMTNKLVIAYAVPITYNNHITNIMVQIKDGNTFCNIVNQISFLSTGQAYMIDKNGTTIADKNEELVKNMENTSRNSANDPKLKDIVAIEKKMILGETGVGEYTFRGITKYTAYAPIKLTGWSFSININKMDLLSGLSKLKYTCIIITLIILVIVSCFIVIFSRSIEKALIEVKNHMKFFAKGNFAINMDNKYLDMKDEVGVICNTMSSTQNSISNMIKIVKNSTIEINNNSTNLAAIAEELSILTENISTAIDEVAVGTTKQATDVDSILQTLNGLKEQINGLTEYIKAINTMSMDINDNSKKSNSDMKELIACLVEFNKSFSDFSSDIVNMDEDIKKVNDIIDIINSISEQTNLLALNAAIEAARAGDAGKGFAVVADEIRALAEKSKQSSSNIYNIIMNLLDKTKNIVNGTQLMNSDLKNQKQIVENTINSFNNISTSVNNITPKINEISNAFVRINTNAEEIVSNIESVSAISQEISASSEEIAASSNELNKSSLEVSTSAQDLAEKSSEMMKEVEKFKIK